MEVQDEAVDIADMDEFSMALLAPAPPVAEGGAAAGLPEGGVENVTITINASGEINVDQSALAAVLGSGQQSARVTFVRVGEEGESTIENEVVRSNTAPSSSVRTHLYPHV